MVDQVVATTPSKVILRHGVRVVAVVLTLVLARHDCRRPPKRAERRVRSVDFWLEQLDEVRATPDARENGLERREQLAPLVGEKRTGPWFCRPRSELWVVVFGEKALEAAGDRVVGAGRFGREGNLWEIWIVGRVVLQ